MEWMPDDEQRGKQGIPREEWVRLVLIAGLLIGLGILVVKWWRRSGGASTPLIGPILALVGAQAMNSRERSDSTRIRVALEELAKTRGLLTPTELFEALKAGGLQWDSPSHMGVQLAQMGIRSQVRTVEGRTARRWYDLSGFAAPAEGTAA